MYAMTSEPPYDASSRNAVIASRMREPRHASATISTSRPSIVFFATIRSSTAGFVIFAFVTAHPSRFSQVFNPYDAPQYRFVRGSLPSPIAAGTGTMPCDALSHNATFTCTRSGAANSGNARNSASTNRIIDQTLLEQMLLHFA